MNYGTFHAWTTQDLDPDLNTPYLSWEISAKNVDLQDLPQACSVELWTGMEQREITCCNTDGYSLVGMGT